MEGDSEKNDSEVVTVVLQDSGCWSLSEVGMKRTAQHVPEFRRVFEQKEKIVSNF